MQLSQDFPVSARNIFLMMRFRGTPQNNGIAETITPAARAYDLNVLRADERSYNEGLWENVKAYMNGCDMGIAVFDQIDDDVFNPNVSIELGYMAAKDKKLLILKEKRLKKLPTDIVGLLYREFDSYDIGVSVGAALSAWLRDIGVAKSAGEKLVLFMSYGGTCRCAMAKVVLKRALRGRILPFKLRVESVARMYGSTMGASNGARKAVIDVYGEDLLKDHYVTRICGGYLNDADLILPMERQLMAGLPEDHVSKFHLFNDFFKGVPVDLPNPWPDDGSEAAADRYRKCMEDIRASVEPNVDRLVSFLASSDSGG